jgi:hypothetical protein
VVDAGADDRAGARQLAPELFARVIARSPPWPPRASATRCRRRWPSHCAKPPRIYKPAAIVWLPGPFLDQNLQPLTSSSVTLKRAGRCLRARRAPDERRPTATRLEATTACSRVDECDLPRSQETLRRVRSHFAAPMRSSTVRPEDCLAGLGHQRHPHVRAAEDVPVEVRRDVRASRRPQVPQIAAEVLEAGRRPPERDVMDVFAGLSRENRSSARAAPWNWPVLRP